MDQPRLFEFRMGERSPDTLVVTEANRDVAQLLTDWRNWPGGALALVGPPGSGKTHLALAWALETGARAIAANTPPTAADERFQEAQGRLLIDDADGPRDEAALWHVLDLARSRGGAVLLVAAQPPGVWPVEALPLRSRLLSLPVARLGEPDEGLMEVVLRRLCREQFIQLSDDAAKYLVLRLPRTFAAARAVSVALDQEVVRGAKPVSVAVAKRALGRAENAWVGERED
ncbi:MAG: chromosomal replication initiator DnaA [Pseudomonadota bacterium]